MNIGIIGTGAYGIALALQFNENRSNKVRMWTKFESEKEEIVKNRENSKVLPGVKIPKDIDISTNIEYVVKNSDIIVIAVPAAFVGDVSQEIRKYYRGNQQFVLASKGIERGSCLFVDEIFRKYIKTKNFCVISGPSFAVDIVTDCPIGLTIASERKKTIKVVRKALENDTIRLRESDDIIGVEICGSIKNVIAIAAGILDGMGYPESTQAMFITESLNDIKELISKLGGNKDTILTYAGFGDLLLTATSKKSRNYSYGRLIGKKTNQAKIDEYVSTTTIEGLYTIQSIYKLLKHKKVRIPIINLIYDIINNKKKVEALPRFLITKK
jgi:glycerol-3-phosphate dehydrogenase (NAD(P)+)